MDFCSYHHVTGDGLFQFDILFYFSEMFFNPDEDAEEDEEENSEDEIGCAQEVLGNCGEQELDFANF